jgi:hypothetical protein
MDFQPPQVDYREQPSAGNSDAIDHLTRDDPNCGGTVYGPQPDDSFHSYDVVGDAKKFNDLTPSAPVDMGGTHA